jgi:hypothetical protein
MIKIILVFVSIGQKEEKGVVHVILANLIHHGLATEPSQLNAYAAHGQLPAMA